MSILGVVKGQRLSVTQDFIVGGTINYLTAYFSFTCDWNGLLKIVHFRGKKDGKDYCIKAELKNNSITEDYGLNLTSGTWRLSIVGYGTEGGNVVKRITTNEVAVAVHKTGECSESAEPFPEIKPSYGEMVIAKAEEACRIANEVKEAAERGDFDGKDYDHSEEFTMLANQVHQDALDSARSAELAQQSAESTKESVDASVQSVTAMKDEVSTLKQSAYEAKEAAETAKTGAESARDEAVQAKTATLGAQSAAETAKSGAETAQANAETAESHAKTYAEQAETAKSSAETSAQSAGQSATDADSFAKKAQNLVESLSKDFTVVQSEVNHLKDDLANKVPKSDYAPEEKTDTMTQPVGKDADGKLWTAPGSGGNADGVSWNELKDKPFYLEKTLFIELTKDDFVMNNEGRPFYTSSPKLDWMTSIDNVSIELNLVYNDGTSYVITENSYGIYFETIREDDGREYVNFGDDENFDIFSGPEDSFSITIWSFYENLTEIHLALYRKDIKKLPSILVDVTIGKTAFNVSGYKIDETTGDDVLVEVPAINIPVNPGRVSETDVFYDTERECLKIPAKIMPWNGTCQIRLNYALSAVVGKDMLFSLKEGDAEWEYLDHNGNYYTELSFYFIPSNSSLRFMVKKGGSKTVTALATSEFGYVYFLKYTYSTDYKTISGAIRRIL